MGCRQRQPPARLIKTLAEVMGEPIRVAAEGAEQEEAPALGFFFKGAGVIKFSQDAEGEVPGSSQTVVVADRFGVVIFSDLKGASCT